MAGATNKVVALRPGASGLACGDRQGGAVHPDEPNGDAGRSVDSDLRELFRREADNAAEAVAIRQSILSARRLLATRDGLIAFPSIDALRRQFGSAR